MTTITEEMEELLFGLEKPSKKEYKILQIEKDIADEFKALAKKSNVTQTMLLKYLIKSTRELQELNRG